MSKEIEKLKKTIKLQTQELQACDNLLFERKDSMIDQMYYISKRLREIAERRHRSLEFSEYKEIISICDEAEDIVLKVSSDSLRKAIHAHQ